MKKVFLGGAAVIAATLLAMSAAWACSPYGDRKVSVQGGGPVESGLPGSRIVVEGTWYQAEYGPVTVEWTPGSDWGEELARPALEFSHKATRPHPATGVDVESDYYKFAVDVTVPDKKDGFIFVFQRSSTYGIKKNQVLAVQASQIGGGPTTTLPPPVTTLAPNVTTPFSPPTTRALAPGSQTGPVIGAPDVQRPAVLGAPDRTIEGGGAAAIDPGAPLAHAEAKAVVGPQLPPWIDRSEPDMQTLWSGLGKSDGATAASLTAPTQPPDEPSKLGAALLSLGALVLVTGGLVTVPRRLASARILGMRRKTSTW